MPAADLDRGQMLPLSPLDASFLALETPRDHMNIGFVGVFDPETEGRSWSHDRAREVVASRLHRMPLLRQRLAEVPFGLNHPLWTDDLHFDLDAHIHRAALPSPGSVRELADLAATVLAAPFDFDRPLWELWTVEGLADGKVAHLLKTHHAAFDGVAIGELGLHMSDTEPEPRTDVDDLRTRWEPSPPPSLLERSVHAARGLLHEPVAAARLAATGAASAVKMVGGGPSAPPSPLAAPRTPFNGHVSSRRVAAFASLPVAAIRAVGDATGATINDVVLAVCAQGLRRLLEERDALPDRPLLALVPRSVRRDDDPQGPGNRVVPMLVPIPTHIENARECLEQVSGAASAAKTRVGEGGEPVFMRLPDVALPVLASPVTRFYANRRLADHHRPLFNLTISNVPGPPITLYSAGARLDAVFPMGPVYESVGLNITVTSYLDWLHVGIVACPERLADPWLLADFLGEALHSLEKGVSG
jgi:diacylglycerol O-acyltransferase / wax synthase